MGERADDGRTARVVVSHEGVTALVAMTTTTVAAVAASGVNGQGVHGSDSYDCHVLDQSVDGDHKVTKVEVASFKVTSVVFALLEAVA